MKQRIFTLLLIAFAGLTACNKNNDAQPDIQQYDDEQIQKYISANGLTGFTKDETNIGDGPSGIYYKMINTATGDSVKYSDRVAVVYTARSMDGKYVSSDTIVNHIDDYLGHYVNSYIPRGVQLAIHDLIKYPGSSAQVLVPSRLAFGVNGFGSGSITNGNRIAGNQSLDYYVHIIKDQAAYDDLSITKYLTANGLTGYTKDATYGYYYKINTQGTGPAGEITLYSNVNATYVGSLLNGTAFDSSAETTATTLNPNTVIEGFQDALLKHCSTGTSISLFIPSAAGYGRNAQSTSIPANSVLHFELQIASVTQP